MTTSRPVLSWPSVCTTIRSRRPLTSSVCWVSARPSSHGRARVLDRAQRRGAGAAVVPGDEHDVGVRLGHAGGDGADAELAHQLDVDARPRVRVLEVVDELLDVLDRVDVVVRRRRDQADARGGAAGPGDPRVDLAAGQLAALAGLGPLADLDLDVVGVHQVLAGDAEAPGRDLLDRAAPRVAVRVGGVAVGVLAALARVAPAAEAVHRDRERLVHLLADRPVGDRAGAEPLDDRLDRLDLLDRHGRAQALLEGEQPAQRRQPVGLLVDGLRVLLEDVVAARAGGVLQAEHRLRVEQVDLALAAPLVLAAGDQRAVVGAARRPAGRPGGGGRAPPRRARRTRRRPAARRCR